MTNRRLTVEPFNKREDTRFGKDVLEKMLGVNSFHALFVPGDINNSAIVKILWQESSFVH